jgi:endonuclease/exonuclease/phosphatase (EEP) superfamily protein YafD
VRRTPSRLLALCSWSYLALALGLWALLQAADLWWPASLLMFAPRGLFALPLLLLLPAAWLLRRRPLLVPLSLAGVVIAGPVMGLCIPWRPLLSPEPSGLRLRVLTCNLHYSKAMTPDGLEALVRESGADVVALQEWEAAKEAPLARGPEWHRHATTHLLLASRYPIRQVLRLGRNSVGPQGSVRRYDLETPAGVVHFFNLHLASPRDGIYEAIHDKPTGIAEVQANIALRWEQSEYVAGQIEGLEGPVVLVGDFNTPPQSALFRRVWGDYSDAFAEAGWGWGYTFTGGRTVVRIDHILVGKGWHCSRCWVGPRVGSPHRPVLADLVWPGPTMEANGR